MGLYRKLFVVGALFALPSPPQSAQDAGSQASSLVSWNYISAAAETVSDFKGFCERKPQVCVTAQYLATSLEGKAKYGAKLVYEWANESGSELNSRLPANLAKNNKADPLTTSSVGSDVASAAMSSSTLGLEDLIPEWRGTLQPEKG